MEWKSEWFYKKKQQPIFCSQKARVFLEEVAAKLNIRTPQLKLSFSFIYCIENGEQKQLHKWLLRWEENHYFIIKMHVLCLKLSETHFLVCISMCSHSYKKLSGSMSGFLLILDFTTICKGSEQ